MSRVGSVLGGAADSRASSPPTVGCTQTRSIPLNPAAAGVEVGDGAEFGYRGIKPDALSYRSLVRVLGKKRMWEEAKALADAKMGKQIGEAKKDASEDKRDADYKVAVEKCDAMAGDAKASCIAAAKAKFGKT